MMIFIRNWFQVSEIENVNIHGENLKYVCLERFSSLNRQYILPVLASVHDAALTVDANQT